MHVTHSLSLIIQRSHSLTEILDATVELLASELGVDVCSVYLVRPGTRILRLESTFGLDRLAVGKVELELGQGLTGKVVHEMRPLAVEDASSHPGYLYFPETREEQFRSFLGVPMVIRNRPVGAIVIQTREERRHDPVDIQTLTTIAAQLVGVVENARLIDALDRGEEGLEYLSEVRLWNDRHWARSAAGRGVDVELIGSPASPGIAIAEVVVRGSFELSEEDRQRPFQGADTEKARFRDALEKTRQDILRIQKDAEKQADEEHALIFSSHLLLLNDPVLLEMIEDAIDRQRTAAIATHAALEEFCTRLRKVSDPYLQERIEDILDLESRMLGYLLYEESHAPNVSDRIVVSKTTPPSLVVELKAKGARALVTEFGGATSHGALLARSMGIPAVTGVSNLSNLVRAGDHLIVDGGGGTVILNPGRDTVERFEERSRKLLAFRSENQRFCTLPARTADGTRIKLLANVGVAADLHLAKEHGAEGIGLYRTEFPFIIREQFPSREEQVPIYDRAYQTFPGAPIHFRLLDLGGDKFLRSGNITADRNPFHGYRSIRVLLDNPTVFRDQVQAFGLAAKGRELDILVPMISGVEELRRVAEFIRRFLAELPKDDAPTTWRLGVMIELPAAVEIAVDLAREADFFSIGTNDLIQYTLAVDRENARVASTRDPYHPAILRMIRRTIDAAHAEGIPVSVCGELASNWRLALLLVALGVDSISITPSAILELKEALARHRVKSIAGHVDELLRRNDAGEIEAILEELLPDPG